MFQVWLSFPQYVLNRFRVAVNNIVRKLVGLPRYCSASEMHVFYRTDNFDGLLRKARANFHSRLFKIDNIYIRHFLSSDEYAASPMRMLILQQTLV